MVVQVNPQELDSQFSRLNELLNGPLLTQRTKDMIRVLFTVRGNRFQEYPAIKSNLNLVDENDKHTHTLEYLHECDPKSMLNEFIYDEHYQINETKYKEIRKKILSENDEHEDELSSNDQSNIQETDCDISSTGSSVNDISSTDSSVADKEN